MKLKSSCIPLTVLLFILSGCERKPVEKIDLSPASWPEGELEEYTRLETSSNQPKILAEGQRGIVSGTGSALAVRAGLEALKQGGSAADAAIVTSLAQIALNAGLIISYAGIWTMVYYEAETGSVHYLHAGWNTLREETDPLSVPSQTSLGTVISASEAGRSVLVPGYMAGLQATHDRFGKLPFKELFTPSIYFAEQGVELAPFTASVMKGYESAITRTPQMREIFTKENGELHQPGDLFRQPQLAETLKNVASQGAEYMYTGEWGKRLVESVRKEGGKMTLEDLEAYDAIWSQPYHSVYRDYDVYTLGAPSSGGINILEALHLAEIADIPKLGHYTASAEALYWLIQISRTSYYMNDHQMNDIPTPPETLQQFFPGIDFSPESRLKKETAELIWAKLKAMGGWGPMNQDLFQIRNKTGHSAAVVAADEAGNVAAVLHTINGGVHNFVDGVSTSTSGALQQKLIDEIGPGRRLPDPTNPLIVMKGGKPVLAASSIGYGLHEETLQDLINILDFGMNPQEALDAIKFGVPGISRADLRSASERYKQTVVTGQFSEDLLEAVVRMGQEIMPLESVGAGSGIVVVITIDPKTGTFQGGAPKLLNGLAEAY